MGPEGECCCIERRAELTEAIGPVATKLMRHLPPDWTQLATRTDLAALGTELRGEITGPDGHSWERVDSGLRRNDWTRR